MLINSQYKIGSNKTQPCNIEIKFQVTYQQAKKQTIYTC